jgi:gamma-glutamyl-gamma-aminobutyrate hydrolase PuuD
MIRPLIGIIAGHQLMESKRQHVQDRYVGCNRPYVDCTLAAGGAPLVLPPANEREAVRAMVAAADGLMFTGGGDASALLFGAEPHPAIRLLDPMRDATEVEATRHALALGMPILAICRGIQLLNIALGGDLIQDIPSQVKGHVRHWSSDLDQVLSHSIAVEKGSLLASLIGDGKVAVNSDHHQAVGRVAKGFRVTARAADGVIEAIEPEDGRPVLAVQFHPERIAGPYPRFMPLFEWLVEAARKFRRSKKKR